MDTSFVRLEGLKQKWKKEQGFALKVLFIAMKTKKKKKVTHSGKGGEDCWLKNLVRKRLTPERPGKNVHQKEVKGLNAKLRAQVIL